MLKIKFFLVGILIFLLSSSCGSRKKSKSETSENSTEISTEKTGEIEGETKEEKEETKEEKKARKAREKEEKRKRKEKEKKEREKRRYKPTLAEIFGKTITADDLDYHLYNLTADSLQGRDTGAPGQKMTAEYLRDFYIDELIKSPQNIQKAYKQEFLASRNNLPIINFKIDGKEYVFGKDFISFFPHDSIQFSDKNIVFAGFGIDDFRYNDYSFRDVRNKIVLIRGGEPIDKYGNYIVTTTNEPSKWSRDPLGSYILKRRAAMKNGAKALLIYYPHSQKYFWNNFKKYFSNKRLTLSLPKDSIYDFFINKKMMTAMTGHDKISEIIFQNKDRKISTDINVKYKNTEEVVVTENISAIIPGKEYGDEYVIIITHYDGLGIIKDSIYNGANDNASGVVASLEIAEAFKAAIDSGFVPKRNIAFINFTGGEDDLLGSRYYIDHPIFPLEQTMAIVELHTLGRWEGKYIPPPEEEEKKEETEEKGKNAVNEDQAETEEKEIKYPINISQKGLSVKDIGKMIEKLHGHNKQMVIKYKEIPKSTSNMCSDYATFMKREVPVLYFYGDDYDDYHKPSDDSEKIDYDLLEKRTNFIFQIIWELANDRKIFKRNKTSYKATEYEK